MPQPLPTALTITSIASYRYNPGLITPYDEGTDDVLTSQSQDLRTNLADPQSDSYSTLSLVSNTFAGDFLEYGGTGKLCGLLGDAELHLLTCTGSVAQTFALVEDAVYSSAVVTFGNVQITPTSATVAPGAGVSLTASTGSSTVWSIREGRDGGSLSSSTGGAVSYTAPANYTHSTETFYVVAINSQNPSQFAQVPVQVTTSTTKSATSTVVSSSASQVPIGASLTLNATVQASGGTPTGTVTFYDGVFALSAAVLNNAGAATYSTSSLALGFHSITAKYAGDSNYIASTSSTVTIAVVAIDPQLSISPTSGTLGVTVFAKTDIGFTPNGIITHTVTLPDNSVSVLQTNADQNGRYYYTRVYSTLTGTYSQVDTDGTTGQSTPSATWTVSPVVANDFSLSVSPSSQTVLQSGSVSYNIATTTTSGAAQTVSFGASNMPSGLSASFSPTSVTTGSQSTLTITASSSAPVGTYTLVIAAASSYTTHTYQIAITVAQAPQSSPVASLNPSNVQFSDQSVGSISSPNTVVLTNTGTGQLALSGIGPTSGNSDYAMTWPPFTPPLILPPGGSLALQVWFEPKATGPRPGQIIFYDNAPGSPQVVSLTGNGLAQQPNTGTINVTATLNNIALPDLYSYGYALSGPTPITGYGANHSFTVSPGTYTITFTGDPSNFTLASVTPSPSQSVAAGGATTTFTLNFTAPNDFQPPFFQVPQGSNGSAQMIQAGQTATYYAAAPNLSGSASTPITFSVTGVPSGAVATFNPQPAYGSSTLTVTTDSSTTTPGVYALTLSGTNSSGLTYVGATSTLAVTTPPVTPVQFVSQSSAGVQGNGGGGVSANAVSADGRFVVFTSSSTNLVSGDTSGYGKVFVRDLQAGTTSEVSLSTSGVPADHNSWGEGISANGQYVVFLSNADNLYPGSALPYPWCGLYVRDLVHGITEREDVAPDGAVGNADSCTGAAISADGRFVAFGSDATSIVSGTSGMQIYLRDRKSSQATLISTATDGSVGNGYSQEAAISADGRVVAFVSSATNLVPQNTNGLAEAFVHDNETGVTSLVSVSSNGLPANAPSLAISADGRYVVFMSASHVYVYDRQIGQTALADVDSVGTLLGSGYPIDPAITADGRFVAFGEFGQVMVRDLIENRTAVVSVSANGQPDNNTSGNGASAPSLGGARVVFASSGTNLVTNDTNGQADAFAAANPFVGSISLKSVSLASSSIPGGNTVTGIMTLTGPAPAGGAAVAVWSNNSNGQTPALVSVSSGATSAQFSLNTSLVSSETIMTIMAAYNGGSGVAVLTLEPAPELTVSPSSFDFGYQAIGTTSGIESFALTNPGTAPLAINSVQLATGQVFKIGANSCGSSIAAGGGCSVSLTFDPNAAGSASDAIQISYGSPATTFSISLSGNGATPVAALSPTPVTFGNRTMPGTSRAVATLTNSGNAPLSGISASISGTNAGDFAISSDRCTGVILPTDSSCLITVSFTPKAKGFRTATLSIADNASGSPQTTSLSGTGVQATPTISWATPAAITYGTALSATQLNATASVAGVFVYSPAAGAVPPAGTRTLWVTFTPTDSTDYTTKTSSVTLTINKAVLTVTAKNASRAYGVANPTFTGTITGFVPGQGQGVLSGTASLTTTATTTSPVGTYTILAAQGTLGAANYTFQFVNGALTVNKAKPDLTWATPAAITYGTALSATQLNAAGPVPGVYVYTPAAGAITAAGAHTLWVTFTPTDSTDYTTRSVSVTLTVNKAALTVTAKSASRTYGVANPTFSDTITGFVLGQGLGALSGTASLTTTATSTSPAGTYPIVAAQGTLAAANYTFTFVNGTLTVNKAKPGLTWATPAPITYGTALSTTQLDASAAMPGTYAYTASVGKVFGAGTHVIWVTFTPSDSTDYIAQSASVTLTVNKAFLIVTAKNASRAYGAANPTFTDAITGFVLGQGLGALSGTASLTTTATSTSPAGTYPIVAAQGTLAAANYTFTFVNGTLTINP
jgi:hypothetical protein